jgi:predicted O-methyltransferase YrrM
MAALSALTAARRPKTILEFGTYDGCSTWHLWANSADDARIITIDLPADVKVSGSTDSGFQGVSQRPFLPDSARVELIEVDSREWTPQVSDGVDLCFIDAGHTYACSKNDTEKALSVMNKNGLILWHDAAWRGDDYGVNVYLKELRAAGRDVRIVDVGPFDYCALAVMIT